MIIFAILFTLTITGAASAADGDTRISVDSASGVQGQTVTLTATLQGDSYVPFVGYVGLAGRTVYFYNSTGGLIGSGTTDLSGKASVSYNIPFGSPTGSQTITARFTGSNPPTFRPSSNTGTLTVTANHAPVANDDYRTINEDIATDINVRSNDTDPDGNSLNIISFTNGANGTTSLNGGNIRYAPNSNYFGTDYFDYTISDGQYTSTARVYLTINPVNDAPNVNDVSTSTPEDTPLIGTLTGTDADGDSLSFYQVTGLLRGPFYGTVTVYANGTYIYTPNANFNLLDDYFTYGANDGHGGTNTARVNIDIIPVNDAPVAHDDYRNTLEDNVEYINVLGNDTDVDLDWLTVTSVSDPAHGTAEINVLGTITYHPDPNYNGPDSFNYTISDGNGGTSNATVYINVIPVNDAPDAQDDYVITNMNTPIIISVLANDTDVDGDVLSLVSWDWMFVEPQHGIATLNPDGTITYTPNTNFIGNDTFVYHVYDGHLGVGAATVHILVNALPNANVDHATTNEDTPVIIDVLANDTDVDGDVLNVTGIGTNPTYGNVVINPNGTITYIPNLNYHGPDFFTYIVSDGKGGTDEEAVLITVIPVNDVPIVPNYSVTTDEDTPVSGTVIGNDDADGDSLSYSKGSDPSHGTVIVNADGTWTYTPAPNYFGSDEFNVTVSDGNGGFATSTISITVNSVNDAPVAVNETKVTDEDTPLSDSVKGNDVELDTLTYSIITLPSHGAITAFNLTTGAYTYTPFANWFGEDFFEFNVTDILGLTDTGRINITVNSVNDLPVAVNDDFSVDEDGLLSGNVATNDTPSGDGGNTWSKATDPANGTVTVNADGSFIYTPNANYYGTDSFDYTITDVNGDTSTATVNIFVNSVNDVPVATDDSATTKEDTPINIDVIANDSDVDGDSLSVTGVSDPAHGSVVINADGTVTYTPDADYYGDDSFTYTVSDGNGGITTGTVNITVVRKVASVYVLTTVSKTNPTVGETITVTFKLGNKGPDPAEDVVFTYHIPEGMEFVSIETQPGYPEPVYDPATRTITWTLGTVPVLDPWFKVNLKVLKAGTFDINPAVNTSTYDPTLESSIQSVTVSAINAVNAASTVEMQETGIPFAGLILAVLVVFTGFVMPKRK